MRLRFKATHVVLAMLCIMYFITYVDRVNIGTAASEIQKELHLTNTQLGLVFSAFAYPYLLFQVIGGWIGDRLGPRKTLFWCGLIWAVATIATGFVTSLLDAVHRPRRARLRRGRDLPDGNARDAVLDTGRQTRFRARPHPRFRTARQCRDAAADRGVDGLADLAWLIRGAGPRQPGVGRGLGAVFPQRSQGSSRDYRRRTGVAAAAFARQAARGAMGTAVAPDVAGHADLFLLRLDAVAVPQLAAAVLQEQLQSRYQELRAVRLRRVLRRRGRRQPRRNPVRPHSQENRQRPLRAAERHDRGFCRGFPVAAADPVHPRYHGGRALPVRRIFLRRDHHRPDVVDPDGHCPEIFGHRRRPDEHRLGAGGDRVAAGGRLRDRRHRQLVFAVPDVDGIAAARSVLGVPDAPGNRRSRRSEAMAPAARPLTAG